MNLHVINFSKTKLSEIKKFLKVFAFFSSIIQCQTFKTVRIISFQENENCLHEIIILKKMYYLIYLFYIIFENFKTMANKYRLGNIIVLNLNSIANTFWGKTREFLSVDITCIKIFYEKNVCLELTKIISAILIS